MPLLRMRDLRTGPQTTLIPQFRNETETEPPLRELEDAMQELIHLLENANVPNFQLECEIWRAIYSPNGENPLDLKPPAYTASIDAALTLVPQGWEWSYDSASFDAFVGDYSGSFLVEADKECHGANKNPAIAICIAALRARLP
jgi:hypothetical protein